MERTKLTRRGFLRGAAAGAGAAAAGSLPVGALAATAAPAPLAADMEADVVVVGGGMAGLTAALKAAASGASVIVLEKQAWPPVSNSTVCYGSVYCFDSQFQRDNETAASVDVHYADIRKYMPWGDPDLQKAYVTNIGKTIDFLTEQGLEVQPYKYPMDRNGLVVTPKAFMAAVLPAFETAGGTILSSTRAEYLLLDGDGAVIGVRAQGEDGKRFDVKANQGVVLAGGGFQLNQELVTRYISTQATRSTRLKRWGYGGTGDSLLMALDTGAKTTQDMNTFYGHLVFLTADGERPKAFENTSSGSLKFDVLCVVVNVFGKRFTDESQSSEMIGQDALLQPESVLPPYARAYVILDDTIYQNRLGDFDAAAKQDSVIASADTLEDLAAKIKAWGVDGDQMVATVKAFNEAVDNEKVNELVPPKSVNMEAGYNYTLPFVNKIVTPPFYAVPTNPAITFTEGGIAVNTECAVLDRDGTPIPHLFAAGDAVGGVAVRQYIAGSGVGKALAQGFMAGQAASAKPAV